MPVLDRIRDFAEERLNVAVRPADTLNEFEDRYMRLSNEAEDLALHAHQYFDGRPVELLFEKRHRLAQRARIAFLWDPIAGREAEMLADFALGNGIAIPRADDEAVQEVIDDAWKDPKNEEVLTGFEAQRAVSNDLRTQANLFLAEYRRNGRIRVAFLDADTIKDVVPDPEDEMRAIYYVGRRRVHKWDPKNDRPAIEDQLTDEMRPKVTYYRHWRNLEDAEAERESNPELGLEALPVIPEEKLDPGEALVYHVRVNRLGRQHFGTPFAARSLRFYSAMNQFTEARVSKALASTALIARRVRRDGPRGMLAAAGAILNQTSELGQRQPSQLPGQPPVPEGQQPPLNPGSWWLGNDGDKIEPLNLSSGGSEAAADDKIIRAAPSVATGWGQHYLGGDVGALAGSVTLELPQLMMVQAWQETLEQLYRHFTDSAIEEAVRDGRLGGTTKPIGDKPLAELRLSESADRADMERRTDKKLDYTFEMPYPGRRNLPDVTGAFQTTLASLSTAGIPLTKTMFQTVLSFLFNHGLQLSNTTEVVEQIIDEWEEEKRKADEELKRLQREGMLGPDGQPAPPGPDGDDKSQYGERRGVTPQTGDMAAGPGAVSETVVPAALMPELAGFRRETQDLFGRFVTEPGLIAAGAIDGVPAETEGPGGNGRPTPTG